MEKPTEKRIIMRELVDILSELVNQYSKENPWICSPEVTTSITTDSHCHIWMEISYPNCYLFKSLFLFEPKRGFNKGINLGRISADMRIPEDAKKNMLSVLEKFMDEANRKTVFQRFLFR